MGVPTEIEVAGTTMLVSHRPMWYHSGIQDNITYRRHKSAYAFSMESLDAPIFVSVCLLIRYSSYYYLGIFPTVNVVRRPEKAFISYSKREVRLSDHL
jgi:hypothetical protein